MLSGKGGFSVADSRAGFSRNSGLVTLRLGLTGSIHKVLGPWRQGRVGHGAGLADFPVPFPPMDHVHSSGRPSHQNMDRDICDSGTIEHSKMYTVHQVQYLFSVSSRPNTASSLLSFPKLRIRLRFGLTLTVCYVVR